MNPTPLTDQASPLDRQQAERLSRLVEALSPGQASWVSGYLAGLAAAGQPAAPAAAGPDAGARITILYGSETGNAEAIAERARVRAVERGLQARAVDMADYKPRELRQERLVMIVTATHGEGEPPDPAEGFHEFVHGRKAPKLEGTRFAVLALGDSSYEHFCRTGREFDQRLAALGAERIHERVDCDVDFEEGAERWIERALDAFARHAEPAPSNVVAFTGSGERQGTVHDRKNPFHAEVLENLVLNGRGSDKETRHIELSLEGSGLTFEPGDVLCMVAQNRPETVAELIGTLGLSGEETVAGPRGEVTLAEALTHDYEITTLTPPFLEAWAQASGAEALQALTGEGRRREMLEFAHGRHVVDVVGQFPVTGLTAQQFVDMLRRLQPREYSIASSHNANPDEVHLTVAAVRYHSHGRDRHGVASTWLADSVSEGDTVPVYVQRNKHFRLPSDPSTPVIMIGPGTGVAPFRAFVEERECRGAGGRNWLFFGDRRFRTDFLYQTEWQRWLRDGVLDRLDVAFSRDGRDKVYVQDRMRENAAELYAWLQDGAHVYVCGDAERMAPDVHRALIEIVAGEGGLGEEQATDYVKGLQRDRRYQRDVY
ncbi:MAG TPA: assimilatory sulfite reductase (NADPH) flavoprotein subunit [Gammaproteobacteria bacterium]|nr:assimilatory sulfite reductase (NADPH) flavoprotein subunit [Gammaproteobacteria bacterium]